MQRTCLSGSQTFSQIAAVGRMVTRALPLLLLFTTFLFINAEVWQVAGTLQGPVFLTVLALFFVLGSAFVLSRVPEAIRSVHDFGDWVEVAALVRGTPAENLPLPEAGDPMEIPLSGRQRLNIGLVSAGNWLRLIAAALVGSLFFVGLAGCQRISEGDFVGKWQSSRAITPIHLAANGEWELRQDDGTILQTAAYQ